MKRLVLLSALAIFAATATPASAAPVLNLDIHHTTTNVAPGSPGTLVVKTQQQGGAGTNEQQTLDVFAHSGDFRLSFDPDGAGPAAAQSTADLAFHATAAQVRSALQALPAIGSGNVNVSLAQPSVGHSIYTVNFVKALAKTDVSELSAQSGSPALRRDTDYQLDVRNVSSELTSGPITLTFHLPAGLSRGAGAGGGLVYSDGWKAKLGNPPDWSCPGSPGDTTVTCTTPGPLPPHTVNPVFVGVFADDAAAGTLTATAEVSGGGADPAPAIAGCPPGAVACATEPTTIDPDPAGFGILEPSFTPDFLAADGMTPARRSGEHPDLFTVPFDLNSVLNTAGGLAGDLIPAGNLRDVSVDLPPGFLGNPTAVGECDQASFTLGACPLSSQVGRIDAELSGALGFPLRIGIFNLTHPKGAITDLGLSVNFNPVHVRAHLDPANGYAITTDTLNINETLPPLNQQVTLWGTPGAHSHDSERCSGFRENSPVINNQNNGDTSSSCAVEGQPRPFLTVPSTCGVEHQVRLHHYDSWQHRGDFGPDLVYTQPRETEDCDVPSFDPTVSLNPTGKEAASPTGLDVSVKVDQSPLANPNALAPPPVKSTIVTFPKGMTFNPAFADGLDGCSEAQFGISDQGVPNGDPVACPDNSRIGEVSLTTPLLPNPVVGSMYLAKQKANPYHTTFALYMAVHDTEQRGILVKIPARIDVDPKTGQITSSFDDLPQFPFSDFTLSFRSGQRAPLMNPPSCGTQTIAVQIASYAQPNDLVDASNSYQVSQGPGGSPCPASLSSRPFNPQMDAGVTNPHAGDYSPFVFRLTRSDAEQDISKVTVDPPRGLIAKLAGVDTCSDQQIAAISTAEGTAQAELDNPHCPSNSLIGGLHAGVGAGTNPNYFNGRLYLAGPYRGAPLSLLAVIPAIAGPYDLGNVVVRVAAHFDPATAQVSAVSDPFPQIVQGILIHVRDVRILLDRPDFTRNPTNCDPMAVNAQILSDLGALATPSNRFQVGECERLGFKPKLFFRLKGGTHRGDHPAFSSRLVARPGDANIGKAIVALPRSEFLENAHIGTICTRVQFAAENCPAASVYGYAKAITPLLDDPVQGEVVLRSSNNPLPDLVARLRGKINANLVGRIDSINGGIRTTFDSVPDVPVREFTLQMKGGEKGLFVNSRNLCKAPARADVRFTAQNGKRLHLRPLMQNGCKKHKKHRRHR